MSRIWLRFLDVATCDPFSYSPDFALDVKQAMIAAVGLDWTKRDQADKLLTARLLDPTMSFTQKTEVALVALELEHQPNPIRREYIETITTAREAKHSDPDSLAKSGLLIKILERLGPFAADQKLGAHIEAKLQEVMPSWLAGISEQWSSSDAAKLCGPVARILAAAREKEMNAEVRRSLPSRLAPLWGMIMTESGMESQLAPLADRMEPNEAAILLTRLIEKERRFVVRDALSELVSIAVRAEPTKAARMLVATFERAERDCEVMAKLALGLSSVAGRMEPVAAAELCGPLADAR